MDNKIRTKEVKQNFTKTPNQYWDLMPKMSEPELRVMGFAIRKINGFRKTKPEPISLSQFMKGTGMSKNSVLKGIDEAIERGWLIKVDNVAHDGTSQYVLVFKESAYKEPSSSPNEHVAVHQVNTQKITLKENVSKETLRGKKAASPPPIITGRSDSEVDPPKVSTDGYTSVELWFYENKAGRQPISDSQREQFNAPNMYVDPAKNIPIDNGPSVNNLFEDKAYIAWLVEDVIPFMKRTKGAKLKNTAYYKPAATDLLKQMRDVRRFYEWKAKQPAARFRPLRKIVSDY